MNSYGYDEISTELLEISSSFIRSPLNYICNKTLSIGIFPDQLKLSEEKPLCKEKKVIKQCIRLLTCITSKFILKSLL
jgi:hypothetical protein